MMCVPPGWRSHSNIMIVPSSVMPAVSAAFAPHCSSISVFVAGIEPAGSPDRMSRLTGPFARSMPRDLASCAIRSAYVGVEQTTVAPMSTIALTRASVVIVAAREHERSRSSRTRSGAPRTR